MQHLSSPLVNSTPAHVCIAQRQHHTAVLAFAKHPHARKSIDAAQALSRCDHTINSEASLEWWKGLAPVLCSAIL
jgi:hypothetical protein